MYATAVNIRSKKKKHKRRIPSKFGYNWLSGFGEYRIVKGFVERTQSDVIKSNGKSLNNRFYLLSQ